MGVNSCHWSVDVRNICLFVCLFVPNPNPNVAEKNKEWNMVVYKRTKVPLGKLKDSTFSLYPMKWQVN